MSTIPITTLSPTEPPPSDASIRGIVTLFWPYSSSTRQCAFLLADPDFRLRNRQGQVRVRFTGASAEAVAKSHVGIGDEVLLALNGANWEEDPEATRTPGKSVGGELFFRRRLQLTVAKSEGDVQVDVDAPASPPRSVEQEQSTTEIATPQPRVAQLRSSLGKAAESAQGYAYTSPAFVKRLRLSGESFLDSAFDPFAEEDGGRTTFGRGTNWRYAAGTPSPTKDTSSVFDTVEQESLVRAQSATTPPTNEDEDEEVSTQMPPPPRPKLQLPAASPPPVGSTMDEQDGPSTPKLHPVRSPTLPLPSPFPVDAFTQSHFPEPATPTRPEAQAQDGSDLSKNIVQHADDAVMVDAAQAVHPTPTEHAEQDVLPAETSIHIIAQPQTPTKIPATTGFGFGFDGATASPASQQKVSPQEVEKERVMAQTYRSLFGFTGSSAAQEQVLETPTGTRPMLSELEKQRLDASSQVAEKQAATEAPMEQDTMFETKEVSAIQTDATSSKLREDHRLPAQPDEVEVIEIESSSEEESEAEDEVPDEPPPSIEVQVIPVGSRLKSPEIPDTYQDSQAADLIVSQQYGGVLAPSRDTITGLERQHTDNSMLDAFIEPEILYPELPSGEPQPQLDPPENEVNATSAQGGMSQPAEPEPEQTQIMQHTLQQPSYPSLPMSPSNSQSIDGIVPQATLEIPDAMRSMLPPTPQLTQVESSTTHLEEMLPTEQLVSQELSYEDSNRLQEQASGEPVAAEKRQAEMIETTQDHAMEERQPPEQPHLETPAASKEHEIVGKARQDGMEESQVPEQPQFETPAASKEPSEPGRMTRARAKKANRVSIIPDAISSYFSPKRSSGVVASDKETDVPTEPADTTTNGHVSVPTKRIHLTNGFSTPLSYFTPLARLDSLLNPSSQGTYGSTNTVDVLAVVTESTTDPARAKAGPKDYYTIFRIADSSLPPPTDLRVEVFRPYKNTLPAAKAGDIVLLRAFAVKSRKRQPYLLSNDASAWCVFRYPTPTNKADGKGGKRKPKWALRSGEEDGEDVSEEMKGPPVEFGEEERRHARDLREWWELTRNVNGKEDVDGTRDFDGRAGRNGHVAVAAGAKL